MVRKLKSSKKQITGVNHGLYNPFKNENNLLMHQRQDKEDEHCKVTGLPTYHCKCCNYYTCYSESLAKHYKKLHGVVNINGDLYNNIIKSSKVILPQRDYQELTFICLECQKFETNSETIIHQHLSSDHFIEQDIELYFISRFNCPDCNHSFKDQQALRAHFTLLHGFDRSKEKTPLTLYDCTQCGKSFQRKASLVLHKKVCCPSTPVKCSHCLKSFSTLTRYELHLQEEHEIIIQYICQVCDKIFNNAKTLNLHVKRHNDKRFACDKCLACYVNETELKVHQKLKHKVTFEGRCTRCGERFSHPILLRSHERKKSCKNSVHKA